MIISWGRPTIEACLYDNGSISANSDGFVTFPTPVEGTTELSSEKGDKMEALIEGGEAEAVKYKRGKYTLTLQIRRGTENGAYREMPIKGIDGVVAGEWTVKLTPEDSEQGAPGFVMKKAVCSYEDSYNSSDGAIRTYTFESLKSDDKGQIDWDDETDDDVE